MRLCLYLFVLLASAFAANACKAAKPQLPADLPLKGFILPAGAELISSEKSETNGEGTGVEQATGTRWTIRFSSPAEWPPTAQHFTMILTAGNGFRGDMPQGEKSDVTDLRFHSPDGKILFSLADVSIDGSASHEYQVMVTKRSNN